MTKITIPAWTAPLWRAVESLVGGKIEPLPPVEGMSKAVRQSAFRRFVDLGVLKIVEKGVGRRPATIEVLVAEVDIAPAKGSGGTAPPNVIRASKARNTKGAGQDSASVGTAEPAPIHSAAFAGMEAAVHGVVADMLGGFARIAGTVGGGIRQVQGAAERLTQAIAAPSGKREAELEHLVETLTAERDQALRDREAALTIAGRARVQASERLTPIEDAIRKIRRTGDAVVKNEAGKGWIVNNAKQRPWSDAELIERASKIGA